jgi:gamma-glutamylaminecyclotransferase
MSPHRIFVYGSLLRGLANHAVLGAARYLGTARTEPRWTLRSLGSFPALCAGGYTSVAGELYELNDAELARVDRLEGHPTFYRRTALTLADGSLAETYVYQHDTRELPLVPSGDWRAFQAARNEGARRR